MTRDQALKLIEEHVENHNIIKHMLATEIMMKTLAKKYEPEKEDEWGMAGLLHDGDYCKEVPENMQGVQISKWAIDAGYEIPDNVKHAMAAHNWHGTGVEPVSKMDWALFCGDSLTGLIVAGALVLPDKKLADLTSESVLKRFKEPSFAKGTRREDIKMCESHLGISLEEFVRITLQAMQSIHEELGL
jgi:predicted hydrolase (HD superfamily)